MDFGMEGMDLAAAMNLAVLKTFPVWLANVLENLDSLAKGIGRLIQWLVTTVRVYR
jgi:hypothetical protein